MDRYELNLIKKINELANAKTALQRSRYLVLMQLLGQYQREKENRNLE